MINFVRRGKLREIAQKIQFSFDVMCVQKFLGWINIIFSREWKQISEPTARRIINNHNEEDTHAAISHEN